MPSLASLQNVYLVIGFLVPGMIATFVRSQFITGRTPTHSEALLSYLALSIIYYALTLPFVDYALSFQTAGYEKTFCWFTLVFVGPALLGLILGLNVQREWLRRALRRLHLNPVHAMPTAWDWRFGSMQQNWMLVTLKDGTRFAGYCGQGSFMSSDPKERDLYMQHVFNIDDETKWLPTKKSVLITAGEIRTVEFWPIESGEPKHD